MAVRNEPAPDGDGPAPDDTAAARRHGGAWIAAAVVIGAFGWYVYDRTQSPAEGSREVPLIRADDGPTKKRPEDPGGMVVPDQDKLVYETLNGTGAEETVERLLPPPEEPLAPPEPPPEPEIAPAAEPEPATGASTMPALPPAEIAPQPEAPAAPTPAEPEAPESETPDPAIAEPAAPAASGPYLVQLASFRAIEEADRAWRRLVKENRDLLGALTARVERADLGADQGVFYRLRVGALAGEDAAKALCGKLKARNVDCLVVRP